MIAMTASGNLVADPEVREVNGKTVANFRMGCRSGKDETTWVNCSVWGSRASTVEQYFKKGSKVTVSGRGALKSFTRKDGIEGMNLNLEVNDFTLPERKAEIEDAPF